MTSMSIQSSYLENYCKLLYYGCVIPFKPRYNCKTQTYSLQRNIFHNILYISVQLLVLLNIGQSLILKTKQGVESHPLIVFKSATLFIEVLVVLCWNYCFHTRAIEFANFLTIDLSLNQIDKRLYQKIRNIITLGAPFVLSFFGHIGAFYGSDQTLKSFIETNLSFLCNEKEQLKNLAVTLANLTYYYLTFMGACSDIFILVLAISINDFATKQLNIVFVKIEKQSNNWPKDDKLFIKMSVRAATEFKVYFSKFNNFCSPIFLFWFCLEISWLPTQFVNNITIRKHAVIDIASVVYTWSSVVILISVCVLFSEARKKV